MASTLQSTLVSGGEPARAGLGLVSVSETYEASSLVLNDVIQMIPIPANATVVEVILGMDDIDSGTDVIVAVGDGDDPDRYITASDIGQAGGFARMNAMTGFEHKYSADDTIDVKVTTAPTGGSGTVSLTVLYHMHGQN